MADATSPDWHEWRMPCDDPTWLDRAAGWTPAQHDAAARRAVDRIDPNAADDRRRHYRLGP